MHADLVAALRGWLDACGIGEGELVDVDALGGGTQNRLVRFRRGADRLVLRMPPAGAGSAGDATMLREARVLAALGMTDVPHPRLVRAERDPEFLGCAFYVMAYVPGRNLATDGYPHGHHGTAVAAGIGHAVGETLGLLAEVDHAAIGLADVGRPDGFLGRQVERWLTEVEVQRRVRTDGGPSLRHLDALARWLDANRPTDQRPGIIHGDVHLANVLVDVHRPRVSALVDWELTTIGDPLLDLGQALATWPGPDGRSLLGAVASVPPAPRVAPAADLVDGFRSSSRRDLTALPWYRVLAAFRLAVILEGAVVRADAGVIPRDVADELSAAAVRLLVAAHDRWRA